MAFKNKVDVKIDGRVFSIKGTESEDYLQMVATYIDNKIKDIKNSGAEGALNPVTTYFLACLNLADDYFKAKESYENLRDELEAFKRGALTEEEISLIKSETSDLKTIIDDLTSENKRLRKAIDDLNNEKKTIEDELDKYMYALDSQGGTSKGSYGFKTSKSYNYSNKKK